MIQSCLNTIYRTFVQSKHCIVRRPLLQNFIMINLKLNGNYLIHKHGNVVIEKTNAEFETVDFGIGTHLNHFIVAHSASHT